MEYDADHRAFFTEPQPEPRFQFSDGARGWRIGAGWEGLDSFGS